MKKMDRSRYVVERREKQRSSLFSAGSISKIIMHKEVTTTPVKKLKPSASISSRGNESSIKRGNFTRRSKQNLEDNIVIFKRIQDDLQKEIMKRMDISRKFEVVKSRRQESMNANKSQVDREMHKYLHKILHQHNAESFMQVHSGRSPCVTSGVSASLSMPSKKLSTSKVDQQSKVPKIIPEKNKFSIDKSPTTSTITHQSLIRSTVSVDSYSIKKPPIQQTEKRESKHNFQCKCGSDNILPCCTRGSRWIKAAFKNCPFDHRKYKQLYDDIVNTDMDLIVQERLKEDLIQIKRDLHRTFPDCPYFMEGSEGIFALERVLISFAKYDPSIGYVQGMNFIVAALLFHCSEEIAFWLFISLVEDFELRELFQSDFPGLYKHTQIIDMLILEHLRDIYSHFCNNQVKVEMFAIEWILTLFTCLMPIEHTSLFLDGFFKDSCIFFYKFVLHLLRAFEEDILVAEDIAEMISPIKESLPKGNLNRCKLFQADQLNKKMHHFGFNPR